MVTFHNSWENLKQQIVQKLLINNFYYEIHILHAIADFSSREL